MDDNANSGIFDIYDIFDKIGKFLKNMSKLKIINAGIVALYVLQSFTKKSNSQVQKQG